MNNRYIKNYNDITHDNQNEIEGDCRLKNYEDHMSSINK
jgi:hypothetical protein